LGLPAPEICIPYMTSLSRRGKRIQKNKHGVREITEGGHGHCRGEKIIGDKTEVKPLSGGERGVMTVSWSLGGFGCGEGL